MQSDSCCELALALIGRSYDETEPIKTSYLQAGRKKQNPEFIGVTTPPHITLVAAKV